MALKNNRTPVLCYFKLCALFRTHWWIQTGVTVRKRPIWVKFEDFVSRVTLKLNGWPWKTIGHLLYATSSFVHQFVPIGEFKLELQSGNAQIQVHIKKHQSSASLVPGELPAQRPVARSFDVFFDLHLNKRLSKQWWVGDFRRHRAHYDVTVMCFQWRHLAPGILINIG